MSRSPLSQILLPAAIVSASIFALMMAGFTILRSPDTIAYERENLANQSKEWILPSERDNYRIRQVGMALIVSVGTGLLTVEGLRRWYAFHGSAQNKAKRLGLEEFLQETESPSDKFEI